MPKSSPTISMDELRKLITSKHKYVLIDIREPHELEFGMIPTAKNLPLSELPYALNLSDDEFKARYKFKKPKTKDDLILYCRTGGRSDRAALFMRGKGYAARNYKGSIWEWAKIDSNVKRYGPEPKH